MSDFAILLNSIVEFLYLAVVGFGTVFGLMYFIYKRDAHFWEALAVAYARPWREPDETRGMRSAVVYKKGGAFKSYKGLLTIGLYEDGFAMKPMRLFSLFHKPIFIPYEDVEGWREQWFLDGGSIELTFAKRPDVKMIMPESQVRWIEARGQGRMAVRDMDSPYNAKPKFWYALILVNALFGVSLLSYILFTGDFDLSEFPDNMRAIAESFDI